MKAPPRRVAAAAVGAAAIASALIALRPTPPTRPDALGDPLPEGALCRIGALRFTPIGRHAGFDATGRVVTGCDDGTVRIFDPETGREVERFDAHTDRSRDPSGPNLIERLLDRTRRSPDDDLPDGVRALAISPDRSLVATCGKHVVRVFEIATGREQAEWTLWHTSGVVWTPDGRELVVLAGSVLWRLRLDGGSPPVAVPFVTQGATSWGWSLGQHVSPVVRMTSGTGTTTAIETLDLVTGVRTTRAWTENAALPVPDSEGTRAARVLPGEPVVVIEDRDGRETGRFPAPGASARVVGWTPDGTRLLVGAGDHVHVLGLDGRPVAWFPLANAYCPSFTRDSRRALLVGAGGVHVLDATTWTELGPDRPRVRTTEFAFLRGTETLAVATDRRVALWDARSGVRSRAGAEIPSDSLRLEFDPTGRRLVAFGLSSATVMDLPSGAVLGSVPWTVSGMIVRGQETLVLRSGPSGWSAVPLGGGAAMGLGTAGPFVQDEDGERLLVGGTTGALLLDTRTGATTATPGPRTHVASPCLSADASIAAVVDIRTSRLHVVRVADGTSLLETDVAPAARGAVALSADGSRAAVAVEDGTSIAVFETVSGDRVATFGRHEAPIRCVRFSGDGRLLATGSADLTILVWDLAPNEGGR